MDSCLQPELKTPRVLDLKSCQPLGLSPVTLDEDRTDSILNNAADHTRALQQKKTMLVGHNVFLDLVYFYKRFFGPLPTDVKDFVPIMKAMFPIIFDTKFLADNLKDNNPTYKSSLEDIIQELESSDAPSPITGRHHIVVLNIC